MRFTYNPISAEICTNWRNGGMDANGQPPERAISDGEGNPCRHCLRDIKAGVEMLILAARPFEALNPYAETGPVFLCAHCEPYLDILQMPPVLEFRKQHLLKGYSALGRIVTGTGEIVQTPEIDAYLNRVFGNPDVAYVHVRSDTNNCFTLRIDQQ